MRFHAQALAPAHIYSYKVTLIHTKLSTQFFTEKNLKILKIHMEMQKSKYSQTILDNKNTVTSIRVSLRELKIS